MKRTLSSVHVLKKTGVLQVELEMTTHPDVKACKAVLSDFITAKFEDELELCKWYRAKKM